MSNLFSLRESFDVEFFTNKDLESQVKSAEDRERISNHIDHAVYCEQVAEFATDLAVQDYRLINYHRAFIDFLEIGLYKEAARIALAANSECLMDEITREYKKRT
jgi:hypothetical protein